jgi:hypothetical protein
MASEQDQLPSDDGIQGRERAGGECRDQPTEVTGRRRTADDTLERPSPDMVLDLVLDSTKGRKTGVDSE